MIRLAIARLALASLVAPLALAPLPAAAAGARPADVSSLGLTATYDVQATFGWDDRRATVATTAHVTNSTRWPVSTLYFNLSTFRNGHAELGAVSVDGAAVEADVDDQTIIVPLSGPLTPGNSSTVDIAYTARFNADSSVDGDAWEFARIGDVLTAYRWIPWLSRPTPFDRPNVGDPFVTNTSPHVRVTITTDRAVTYATSGRSVANDGLSQTFEVTNVRDFNLAGSPSYRSRSVDVAGTRVTFYYLTLPADAVLNIAARAMRDYAAKIAPFPHQQLTIAEIGPWSAFESPAHFWLPSNATASLLPWMVAHEVAHQWFYSAVGNDQSLEPFADEAVSDLLARSLLSKFVASQCPTGRLDHSIYDIGECYAWVVYVQGVAWLREVKNRAGSAQFWSALAAYYHDHRDGLGGNRSLLAALASVAGNAAVDYRLFPYTYPAWVVSMPFGPVLR